MSLELVRVEATPESSGWIRGTGECRHYRDCDSHRRVPGYEVELSGFLSLNTENG